MAGGSLRPPARESALLSRRSALVTRLLAVGFLLWAAPSRADDIAAARQHFADGVKAFQEGDFEGARRLFVQADQDHHAPAILYNLGRAEERLNHPQAAIDAYDRYLAEAGAGAELSQAAAIAIAQIRARSSRVRITSDPPGARVFVNGTELTERAPLSTLLPPGHAHVTADWEGVHVGQDVELGAGADAAISLARPAPAPVPEVVRATPEKPGEAHESGPPGPTGLVYGGDFILVPYAFQPSSAATSRAWTGGVMVGLTAEVGYAFHPRAEFLLRVLGAVGSECPSAIDAHFASAGPAISVRLTESFWMGASLLGGNARTCRPGQTLSTDIVFSPSLDFALAVTTHDYGQWRIIASLAYYFANTASDNSVLYFPTGFGAHSF